MGTEADLLRMLEPAVRPVAQPQGGASRSQQVPFERQSFESLLASAQQGRMAEPGEQAAEEAAAPVQKKQNELSPLSGIDRIENDSLRALIAGQARIN